jgi:hypothetical protein
MKRFTCTAVLAAVLVAGAVSAGVGYKNGTDLTGTWRVVATIPAGVPVCPGPNDCVYPALTTATSDGAVLQTAPISNTLTGHGSWKRVGLRSFRIRTVYFRVDPNTGTFIGTSETTIDVTTAPGGQTADGSFTAVILDTSGAMVTEYSGTVTAERIEVE